MLRCDWTKRKPAANICSSDESLVSSLLEGYRWQVGRRCFYAGISRSLLMKTADRRRVHMAVALVHVFFFQPCEHGHPVSPRMLERSNEEELFLSTRISPHAVECKL